MAIVDNCYYANKFYGETIASNDFPRYEARAEDVVLLLTKGRINEDNFTTFPERIQELVKKAICAQCEYFSIYGLDISSTGLTNAGFTVGKVSVNGGGASESMLGAKGMISPLVYNYLEQTGLLDPSVGVVDATFIMPWRAY